MNVQEALFTLRNYCYSNGHCDQCKFSDLREDMGFICWINKIVDNEEFMKKSEMISNFNQKVGEWIKTSGSDKGDHTHICSICGSEWWSKSMIKYNYCPTCGSKMGGIK